MSSSIYLIGGGELRDGDTQLIDEDILSLAPKGSSFVFFNFAAGDSEGYAETIKSVYGRKYKVVLPSEAKGKDFAINAIESAAVIYIGGGNTDQLLRVFKRWGLVEHLQAAIDRGVHVAGMSAGAQALSTQYVDEDSGLFELRKGWGIIPVGVLVHANPTSFSRTELLWPNDYPTLFVAIGEGAAWRVRTTEAAKIGLGNIWTIPRSRLTEQSQK